MQRKGDKTMSKKVEATNFQERKIQLLEALKTMSFFNNGAEKEAFLKGVMLSFPMITQCSPS